MIKRSIELHREGWNDADAYAVERKSNVDLANHLYGSWAGEAVLRDMEESFLFPRI